MCVQWFACGNLPVTQIMYRRYLVVLGALLVQSVTIGCVFAYGVFFPVLEDEFGWSRTELSSATAFAFLCMGCLAIVAGRLNDQFGPRGVIVVSGFCTGTAYLLMYFLSEPWQLFLIYGLLVGVGLAAHDVVTLSTVARWFPKRRGIMSGVVKVGTAVGQMLVPLAAVALISSVGWRLSFVVLGLCAVVLLMVAAWLIGIKPEQVRVAERKPSAPVSGLSFKQARRTRQLWILCAMQFFFFASLTTIPTHIVPHGMDGGMTAAAAASVLSIIAGSSIFGRLLVGQLTDKVGGRVAFVICLAGLFCSLASLLIIKNASMLYVFALCYGFSHGGLFTVVSPTIAEYFGMRAHGVIFGAIVFFGTLGGSSMPVMTGMIYDRYGSYDIAFIVLTVMAAASLILATVLGRPDNPQ